MPGGTIAYLLKFAPKEAYIDDLIIDFMTAESAEIPYAVLNKVMNRIINEVKGVNRVFYDLTSKPPGTIEFE